MGELNLNIGSKEFIQDSGDYCDNFQAEQIIVNKGLDYLQVKEIFKDLFASNFYELQDIAKETAEVRVNELMNEVITKLQQQESVDLNIFKEPDFQYILFESQKIYARSGKIEYRELISNLLVNKINNKEDDLLNIVFNEAIITMPKLLPIHFDILTLVFLIKNTRKNNIDSFQNLKDYLENTVSIFCKSLPNKMSILSHLQYTSCGNLLIGDSIEKYFSNNYPQLFSNGFTEEQISSFNDQFSIEHLILVGLVKENGFISFSNDGCNKKLYALTEKAFNLEIASINKLKELHNSNMKNEQEVKKILLELCEFMKDFMKVWDGELKTLTLTTVGIVLACINYEIKTGKKLDLSMWI